MEASMEKSWLVPCMWLAACRIMSSGDSCETPISFEWLWACA